MSVSIDKDSAVWTHIRQEIGGGGGNRTRVRQSATHRRLHA